MEDVFGGSRGAGHGSFGGLVLSHGRSRRSGQTRSDQIRHEKGMWVIERENRNGFFFFSFSFLKNKKIKVFFLEFIRQLRMENQVFIRGTRVVGKCLHG